jgi:hypothetical protein
MIRAPKLAVSRPMYAFDPATWQVNRFDLAAYRRWAGDRPTALEDGQPTGGEVRAAWFRRKNGRTLAAMGVYRPRVMHHDRDPRADTYLAWIEAADDNRYGASHWSSWDGETLLTTDPPRLAPAVAAERIAFLDAMLCGFPGPPDRYDGWWTVPRESATGA